VSKARPDILGLIDLIYAAVEETARWPAFMEAVCRATATTHGVLALHVPGRRHLQIGCLYGWTQQLVQLYEQRYAHIDPWLLGGDRIPEGTVDHNRVLCSEEEFYGSVAYREFYGPNDCYHGCGAIIKRTEDGLSFLTQVRPKESGPYGEPELSILRRLIPHLQRAVRLHGELSSLRSQLAAVRHVMDLYPQGFLQTDADCRVIYANETARGNDTLTVESGQLQLQSSRGNHALRKAILKMSGDVHGRLRRLDVARDAGEAPYRLLLMPVPKSRDATAGENQPAVSILMIDLNSSAKPDPGMLGELFSLTPAESRFTSCLVTGFSVEEISKQLGITRETARTHLRRVLGKTHTRGQGELISLVLRSIPFPRV
jgi:DNA-binding CsgD family transcriptional regulator